MAGKSGSGKSTFLKILLGFHLPDTGDVLYKNEKLKLETNRIRKLVGFVSQENSFYEKLSVEENYNLRLELNFYYSIYLINGEAKINNVVIEKDDFIKIYDQEVLEINSKKKSDFFIVKSPRRVSYTTYI